MAPPRANFSPADWHNRADPEMDPPQTDESRNFGNSHRGFPRAVLTTFYLYFFALPQGARSHPIIGRDQNIAGFALTFDTGRVDRATMNFDILVFKNRPRPALLYFTNIPPESMSWISNLQCQVFSDIPGAGDQPRGPVVRHGQKFT